MSSESAEPAQKKSRPSWAPLVLAAIVLAVFTAVLEYLLRGKIDPSTRDIVLQMIETLKAITIMVVSYFVGTTAASERKTDIIAQSPAVQVKE